MLDMAHKTRIKLMTGVSQTSPYTAESTIIMYGIHEITNNNIIMAIIMTNLNFAFITGSLLLFTAFYVKPKHVFSVFMVFET